jgi:hypothetical protein
MTDKTEEAKAEVKEKLEGVVERSKTADERLDKYFAPQVEEKQPEPKPSSNQTTDETPKEETPEVETKVEEKPEPDDLVPQEPSEEEALANSKNPERTKAYIEKLKEEIKKKEQEAQPQPDYGTSVFDQIHPQEGQPILQTVPTPYLNPLQKENFTQQFVDAEGNVDIAGLNKALSDANRIAYEAMLRSEEVEMRQARTEETNEVREAHSQFPEIDPGRKDKFDPILFDLVTKRLADQMRTGRRERLIDAVVKVKETLEKRYPTPVQPVAPTQEVKKARVQGPFESGSASKRAAQTQGQMTGDVRSRGLNDRTKSRGLLGDAELENRLNDYFKSQQ